MSKAMINPSPAQRLERDINRIKTLNLAIEKAQSRNNTEKLASLQEELERRQARVDAVKALLADS